MTTLSARFYAFVDLQFVGMEEKNTFGYNVPFPSKLRKHINSRKASVSPQTSQTTFWGFPLGEQRNRVGGVIAWCGMVSPRHSADCFDRQLQFPADANWGNLLTRGNEL